MAFATRYYWDAEEQTIGDNLEFESEWVTNMTPLLAQGDKEEWKLIDLRPLRKLWINRERKMTPEIKNYLRGNDYVIIMPPLPETTPLSELK